MSKFRIITASSLFDGHDVSINIFRKMMQMRGTEVIHLGHNRSVKEVLNAALQEDADAVLVSSYQGGHMEYFKYLYDQLKAKNAENVLVFGGGGGTITPDEAEELEKNGIEKIYHALEGQKIGIEGIADDIILRLNKKVRDKNIQVSDEIIQNNNTENQNLIAKQISFIENNIPADELLEKYEANRKKDSLVVGITGPGGSGKSSMIDELVNRFLRSSNDLTIGVLSVDPSKRTSGGALLGDRIRFNFVDNERVYFRSFASRESASEISDALHCSIELLKSCGVDIIIAETSGIGQRDSKITSLVDQSIYVMTAEFGAPSQLDKIDMLELADFIVLNKFEKSGSEDAFREITLNFVRNNKLKIDQSKSLFEQGFPIFAVSSNQFNNHGLNQLFKKIVQHQKFDDKNDIKEYAENLKEELNFDYGLIKSKRVHYLSQVADSVENYHKKNEREIKLAADCYALKKSVDIIDDEEANQKIQKKYDQLYSDLNDSSKKFLENWNEIKKDYDRDKTNYSIFNKDYEIELKHTTLSGLKFPKVALPKSKNWDDLLRYFYKENLPGAFPYTAGVFPFKRTTEMPKRQFAGEGSSKRTNKRFHYLTNEDEAKRLSVAFDGITLYGEDPAEEPDIYGKIGESGVSISTIEEMDILLDGFDQTDPFTSVSMTINAPAPIILAMYFMVAYRREKNKKFGDKEISESDKEKLKIETFKKLRGTVQADMLKEDQAQNTCIFSIDFAMRMIADVEEYLVQNKIKNYYSLSISGYHIAEAGANPITQLAFTLANGFTYVEYFLQRGMDIDDFAPDLSFFFSNGLDPEYSVIGRVARRIWAIAMRDLYGANSKSQKLKYHIQTSGRSLHAQEISFNDIRTTLQALTAFYDNCNSLHTNSYDEAITTPTEESVRRSMAIQMIVNDEMGLVKNENPGQGSYIIEELTDLVEEAILNEFHRLSQRGGVTGAMEKQYQRSKIQEESIKYEMKKHTGELPIIGVNKFVNENEKNPYEDRELTRCSNEEKNEILNRLKDFKERNKSAAVPVLKKLEEVSLSGGNIFEELLNTVEVASLGQITNVLYRTGGKYRRGV